MALYEISFTIRDSKNHHSVMAIHVVSPDLVTEEREDPADFAQEYALRLDGLIDGQITRIRLTRLVALPVGIKATPTAISKVEDGALFIWRTDNGATVRQRVPTFSEDFVLADGTVDVSGDVADWSLMNTEPVELPADWLVEPSSSRGEDIVSRVSAHEDFKKSRR